MKKGKEILGIPKIETVSVTAFQILSQYHSKLKEKSASSKNPFMVTKDSESSKTMKLLSSKNQL